MQHMGSIPVHETKIPHAMRCGQIKKKKKSKFHPSSAKKLPEDTLVNSLISLILRPFLLGNIRKIIIL